MHQEGMEVERQHSLCNRFDPSRTGGTVYGWPSKGGVLILFCSVQELKTFGLEDAVNATRLPDPAEEDSFCRKLRLLGAQHWTSVFAFKEAFISEMEHPQGGRAGRSAHVALLDDGRKGIWVVKLGASEPQDRESYVRYHHTLSELRSARTMEERRDAIEKLGGTYYEDPEECEDTRWDPGWVTSTPPH